MDDIRRRDLYVLFKELASFSNVIWYLLAGYLVFGTITGRGIFLPLTIGSLMIATISTYRAYRQSVLKRFHHARLRELWNACANRKSRLDAAFKKLKKSQIADLQELPVTIDRLFPEVYRSLRKSDSVLKEITDSERNITPLHSTHMYAKISDEQAQELYRVADRNVAEYRRHFKQALAGIERAEAQAAVFTTTLDTLRIRMLNYRLTGKSPESETREFLNVIAEARMQFEAIDKALEEIELMPFPQTITVLPGEDLTEMSQEDSNEERLDT
ncbi:hypothetical protein QPK87_31005 [Kamptonema cortianum]|nr:hypothetical protein [Geitlerinema splendidum]MDK3160954.1 hypothetical protein [Kamptonema cortianum]